LLIDRGFYQSINNRDPEKIYDRYLRIRFLTVL